MSSRQYFTKISSLTLIILILSFLLSGCNSHSNPETAGLNEVVWTLTNLNGSLPLDGRAPTLEFNGQEISGNTGCNLYGGTYEMNGESIRFEGIYSTEMACLDPEGLMEQERVYLDLLLTADQFDLNDHVLTLYAQSNPILTFEIQKTDPEPAEPTGDPQQSVTTEPTPIPTSTLPHVVENPEGFNPYQDPITGITISIPEDWIVTGIIEGEYAILQSYPEDKYVGGEGRDPEDTKCDLNIRPEGEQAEDLIEQWKSDPMNTIVSENEFLFLDGSTGRRFVIDSMGQATVFITEINERTVLLTCFGNGSRIDEIAKTINAGY